MTLEVSRPSLFWNNISKTPYTQKENSTCSINSKKFNSTLIYS